MYREKSWKYFSSMALKPIDFLLAGLEPVLSQTEKSCISSYYRQLSTNMHINSLESDKTGVKLSISKKFLISF